MRGRCKYIHLFIFFSIIPEALSFCWCEPFQWAFKEEKGTGQLNLNGSGMCTEEAERKVLPYNKECPSFVGEWGQRSLTLLLLQLRA